MANTYCEKVWLTDSLEPSTSSITCFHGPVKWHKNPEGEECSWIEIANCSDKARLHRTFGMSHGEWVDQVMRLRDEVADYLDYLSQQDRGEGGERLKLIALLMRRAEY